MFVSAPVKLSKSTHAPASILPFYAALVMEIISAAVHSGYF